jgi:hypothetical protein
MRRAVLLTSLPVLALMYLPRTAYACGGFFCSQQPVLQTAERIVFVLDEHETVAYIQLQYSGTDPNFAWIVPVPAVPTVEVGVGQKMFDTLDAQTQPMFKIGDSDEVVANGALDATFNAGCGGGGGSGGFSGDPPEPEISARYVPPPDVNIYASERVGPYDYVTLDAKNAEDLNDWLGINGYQPVPGSEQIVQAYLDQGMKLLALKLAPAADATAVEPIKLTYPGNDYCMIPLKLTAIAAQPRLEIVTWVFGEARAVPEVFAPVTVDPVAIGTPANYEAALGISVDDQAAGRGFVTEYAQNTARLSARGDVILQDILAKNAYVTRLRTFIDPSEMTEDPEFTLDPAGAEVSNVIQLPAPGTMSTGTMLAIFGLGLYLKIRSRRRS